MSKCIFTREEALNAFLEASKIKEALEKDRAVVEDFIKSGLKFVNNIDVNMYDKILLERDLNFVNLKTGSLLKIDFKANDKNELCYFFKTVEGINTYSFEKDEVMISKVAFHLENQEELENIMMYTDILDYDESIIVSIKRHSEDKIMTFLAVKCRGILDEYIK